MVEFGFLVEVSLPHDELLNWGDLLCTCHCRVESTFSSVDTGKQITVVELLLILQSRSTCNLIYCFFPLHLFQVVSRWFSQLAQPNWTYVIYLIILTFRCFDHHEFCGVLIYNFRVRLQQQVLVSVSFVYSLGGLRTTFKLLMDDLLSVRNWVVVTFQSPERRQHLVIDVFYQNYFLKWVVTFLLILRSNAWLALAWQEPENIWVQANYPLIQVLLKLGSRIRPFEHGWKPWEAIKSFRTEEI